MHTKNLFATFAAGVVLAVITIFTIAPGTVATFNGAFTGTFTGNGGGLTNITATATATNAIANNSGTGTNTTLRGITAAQTLTATNLSTTNVSARVATVDSVTAGAVIATNGTGIATLNFAVVCGSLTNTNSSVIIVGVGTNQDNILANNAAEGSVLISPTGQGTSLGQSVAVGASAFANTNSTALGYAAFAYEPNTICIGQHSECDGQYNIIIGESSGTLKTNVCHLGWSSDALDTQDNITIIGSLSPRTTKVYLVGNGQVENGFFVGCDIVSGGQVSANSGQFDSTLDAATVTAEVVTLSDSITTPAIVVGAASIFSETSSGHLDLTVTDFQVDGTLTVGSGVIGDGSLLSSLNASAIVSGTLPVARGPGITTNITVTCTSPAGNFVMRITNGIVMSFGP